MYVYVLWYARVQVDAVVTDLLALQTQEPAMQAVIFTLHNDNQAQIAKALKVSQ